jgi:hypothetical protein
VKAAWLVLLAAYPYRGAEAHSPIHPGCVWALRALFADLFRRGRHHFPSAHLLLSLPLLKIRSTLCLCLSLCLCVVLVLVPLSLPPSSSTEKTVQLTQLTQLIQLIRLTQFTQFSPPSTSPRTTAKQTAELLATSPIPIRQLTGRHQPGRREKEKEEEQEQEKDKEKEKTKEEKKKGKEKGRCSLRSVCVLTVLRVR